MAKFRRKKRARRRTVYGSTLERCAQCGELKKCNHTKCAWCHQPLCYRVSFGVIWLDCEYGIVQTRNRETQEITTYNIPIHECMAKRIALLPSDREWFGNPFWYITQ